MNRLRALATLGAGSLVLTACAAGGSTGVPTSAAPRVVTPQAVDGAGHGVVPPPLRDGRAGERLRVTVAGGCPVSPGDAVGVRNEGPPVTDALVPAGAPTGGLVCDYGHGGIRRWKPVVVQHLDAAAAGREAARLRALPLAHPPAGGVNPRSCPPDLIMPAPTRIVVLAFAGRPDVDVWGETPCGAPWTANGWVGSTAD